ncbi:thioredoxin family protein [Paenibacillus anseongense]|uniref:thioredoxin family protein n=1 Tax=Paenibacillus TaxID=44249 RepID=UPI002DBF94E7|nr:thioredoxin family protein [Paenibacillus anseongense]MEC0266378.1 thioredoxin family protein [Paenibacillus anseongense]
MDAKSMLFFIYQYCGMKNFYGGMTGMSTQNADRISQDRRERAFHEALTYQQFIDSAKVNVERFQVNFEQYTLSKQELTYFKSLPDQINVLVLAHDWCGDVVANLPLFAKIERETGKLKLHILLRDSDNQDIAAAYLHKDGRNHIPTYVFFNGAGEELGLFIERPDQITDLISTWKEEFWNLHPEWEGRGKALSELDEKVKRSLLGYLNEQRPKAREQEKTAIIESIRSILG